MTPILAKSDERLTARQKERLEMGRGRLVKVAPFYGYIACKTPFVMDSSIHPPTMATNGKVIFAHPDYVRKMTDGQVVTEVAHEATHNVLRHCQRRNGRTIRRWRIACDIADDLLLMGSHGFHKTGTYSDGSSFEMVPWSIAVALGSSVERYRNLTAEQIYNLLPEDLPGGG